MMKIRFALPRHVSQRMIAEKRNSGINRGIDQRRETADPLFSAVAIFN